MKRFTEKINESIYYQPGNNLGVTNHLTPVDNIVTNAKNLFGGILPVVIAKDGKCNALVVNSSEFTDQRKIDQIIYAPVYKSTGNFMASSLAGYIQSQGLDRIMYKNLGAQWDVYFIASDILGDLKKVAQCFKDICKKECQELEYGFVENEIMESFDTTLYSVYEEEVDLDSDEHQPGEQVSPAVQDTHDITNTVANSVAEPVSQQSSQYSEPQPEQISERDRQLIDQIKAVLANDAMPKTEQADKIQQLLSNRINFGNNWKIRAVKDDNDNTFVALRHTYPTRQPFNDNINDITVSRLAFLNPDQNGIFVYDGEHMDKFSQERKSMVRNILKTLHAMPNTDNPYYYTWG